MNGAAPHPRNSRVGHPAICVFDSGGGEWLIRATFENALSRTRLVVDAKAWAGLNSNPAIWEAIAGTGEARL